MAKGKVRIATCQFAIVGDIDRNFACIVRQMKQARREGADLAHFPECALSGYMGRELRDESEIDYGRLERRTREILELAQELKLWVVLGSTHRLGRGHHTGPLKRQDT